MKRLKDKSPLSRQFKIRLRSYYLGLKLKLYSVMSVLNGLI